MYAASQQIKVKRFRLLPEATEDNDMLQKKRFLKSAPVVWVRGGRGGAGYEDRAVGRIVRTGADRVTILVYRALDDAWVIRSVGAAELEPASPADLARLEGLEREGVRAAA